MRPSGFLRPKGDGARAGTVVWLGVDDTDSRTGGCTTHVLVQLLRLAATYGMSPIGAPRLVRLNPNVPWKTRGNGALSVRLGYGRGPHRRGGVVGGSDVAVFEHAAEPEPSATAAFFDRAWRTVRDLAPEEPDTDPALVVSRRRPAPSIYWRAVREIVAPEEAEAELRAVGARWEVRGDARGLVGATAAIAWPGRRHTWELLAYRHPERIGSPRSIDVASVRAVQRTHPELFLCHDATTRRLLIAPHTDCPVLFGLRARDRDAPVRALEQVRAEPWADWVVFRTNQATGDHLVRWAGGAIRPYRSLTVHGAVDRDPVSKPGGHVLLVVRRPAGVAVTCLAFEPTKTLPRVAAALVPGDRIVVSGSARDDAVLRLEGIRVVELVPTYKKRPPDCPRCGRRMRSGGRERGFRCHRCKVRLPPESAFRFAALRKLRPGSYLPTPSARRHLAPLGTEDESLVLRRPGPTARVRPAPSS